MRQANAPASSRLERRKEKTRQKIISTAVTLFQQQGFDATTMEQIAEEADIAKGTLYNYFPVKEAILAGYIQAAFGKKNPDRFVNLRSLPDTRARMVAILKDLMSGVQAQGEIFEKYLTYQVQNILSLQKPASERSGIERLSSEIIRLGQQSGEIRADLPVSILEDQFEFVFVEVAKQFYTAPDTFQAQETIEVCVDLFMQGAQPTTTRSPESS